jgi:1,4-dihydroxy-2-naphthoate octaprenyltransferase
MADRGIFAGVPWWVKWVVVPLVALFVFGGLIVGILSFLIGLLFKVLIFVAIVGAVLYVVRKFMSGKSSGGDW